MNKHITSPTLLLLAMLLITSIAHAQHPLDPNTGGTRYLIAYPDTITNTYDTRFVHQRFTDGIKLMMYSPVNTTVDITRSNGVTKHFQLQAGKFKILELTGPDGFPQPIVVIRNEIVDNTLLITSELPIVVYCYMLTGFGCEAWTPLPVDAWGMQYYAAAHPGEVGSDITPKDENSFTRKNKPFSSEILIIAAFDKTQVSIRPNGTLMDDPPLSVTLNAGQAYLVESTVDTLLDHTNKPEYLIDLGGSVITATKPIGVISGNARAQLKAELAGLGGNSFKNMLIEWLSPTEMHGREFVYMPSWDARKPSGAPLEDLEGKRRSEYVRIYSSDPDSIPGASTSVKIRNGLDTIVRSVTTNYQPNGLVGKLYQDSFATSQFFAHHYITTGRTQAFVASPGISKNEGVSGGGNFIGATYRAWGGYMAEMVPRERWSTFAPYYAPTDPAGMEHFVNVVTDAAHILDVYKEDGSRFGFNRGQIPGTDLYWGTMTVTPGIDHYLEGRNGARFYAVAYGQFQGDDLYRPGAAKKKDDGGSLASRRSNPLEPLMHPAEYEERLGLGYAYPLASCGNYVLRPSDSLKITTSTVCSATTVDIQAINQNPVGLKSITLAQDTTLTNTTLQFFDPINPTQEIPSWDVLGRSHLLVKASATQPFKDAQATLNIKDRTGKLTQVLFQFEADRVILNPDTTLEFGPVTLNSSKDMTVTITNPLQKNLDISADLFFKGTNGFTIVGSTPTLPTVLKSGQSISMTIRLRPTQNKSYYDTLLLTAGCIVGKMPLNGEPALPCAYSADLDFGKVLVNGSRTLDLTLCNISSEGIIQFVPPYLSWDSTYFKVEQSQLDTLKNVKLGPKQCLSVKVTFTSPIPGQFQTTARFHTNANCKRDTSVWIANGSTSGIHDESERGFSGLNIIPNPAAESATLRYTLPKQTTTVITITNVLGQQVLTQHLGTKAAGTQTEIIRTEHLASGMYTVVVSNGAGSVYGIGKMGVR